MSAIFSSAAEYAAMGFRLIRVAGVRPDGTCSCHLGAACATPGKHPLQKAWQANSTTSEDVIASWFEGDSEPNIGLVFGAVSGYVDTEWDGPEAKATAEKYGLLSIPTPTYESSRGGHKLWKYDPRLPVKAVEKIGGLEVRIGGGDRGAMSVLPPSRHSSGTVYRWVDGLSPADIPVASLPEAFIVAVCLNARGGAQAPGKVTARTIVESGLREGERHDGVVRFASGLIMRMRDPHDADEQQQIFTIICSLSQTMCQPPLDREELRGIFLGQLRWGMKARAAGAVDVCSLDDDAEEQIVEARESSPHAASGLELRSGEWFPGAWGLTVVHGDPKEFQLSVLGGVGDGDDGCGRATVTLTSGEWSCPAAVSRKILEATTIDVTDPTPVEWAKIWNGHSFKPRKKKSEEPKPRVVVRGLKCKLMDIRTEAYPQAEQQRYAQVAGWLLDILSNAVRPESPEDDSRPNPSGRPAWIIGEGGEPELYFGWTKAFEDITSKRKVRFVEGEISSLRRRILFACGEADFRVMRVRVDSGVRRRYVVWKQSHIAALESIAHPADSTGGADD